MLIIFKICFIVKNFKQPRSTPIVQYNPNGQLAADIVFRCTPRLKSPSITGGHMSKPAPIPYKNIPSTTTIQKISYPALSLAQMW
jgi:hypothetical protein